ncbi:MAG: hypothetical protein JSV48_23570, partial [Bradyrhizobium sp.]
MVHHLLAVLADRVVDLRRGNAMAVLQHRIERDAIVFLRQILADRGEAQPVAVELAEDAVMIGAPWQNALLLADDGLEHGSGAAHELDAVTAHEAARQSRFTLEPGSGRSRQERTRWSGGGAGPIRGALATAVKPPQCA